VSNRMSPGWTPSTPYGWLPHGLSVRWRWSGGQEMFLLYWVRKSCDWILSLAKWIQSTFLCYTSSRHILILSSNLRLSLTLVLTSRSSHEHVAFMRAICHSHRFLLGLINLITLDEKCAMKLSLCNFLHSPVSFTLTDMCNKREKKIIVVYKNWVYF
jgi:hypothetical protein